MLRTIPRRRMAPPNTPLGQTSFGISHNNRLLYERRGINPMFREVNRCLRVDIYLFSEHGSAPIIYRYGCLFPLQHGYHFHQAGRLRLDALDGLADYIVGDEL